MTRLTDPAQKISEGHHACFGGKAACDGSGESNEAVALGTSVDTVSTGGTVLTPGAVAVPLEDCAKIPWTSRVSVTTLVNISTRSLVKVKEPRGPVL